jgi:hypothetical protein
MLISIYTIYYIIGVDTRNKSLTSLDKRLQLLQSRIGSLFPLMRGSVVRIGTTIKRPTYSLNLKGKTHLVYLGEAKEPVAQAWIENYRKLQGIIDEMTLINIEVIKRMDQPVRKRKSKEK